MTSVLTTWLLLFGLLLQSVAWALPAQRAEQAERLSHEVAHAIDHGHHHHPTSHDGLEHEIDPALLISELSDHGDHAPHHVHAAEGMQSQGLPVVLVLLPPEQPDVFPPVASEVQPPSADPDGLLRPPRVTA